MAKKKLPDQQTDSPRPQSTKKTGDWGEQIAANYLMAQGAAIVERQWHGPGGEIDIIAQMGKRMVFVEVKTRASSDIDPADAVDATKRLHMVRAADAFLKQKNKPFDYQFDIITITGTERNHKLTHIPDAFFPSPRSKTSNK